MADLSPGTLATQFQFQSSSNLKMTKSVQIMKRMLKLFLHVLCIFITCMFSSYASLFCFTVKQYCNYGFRKCYMKFTYSQLSFLIYSCIFLQN